MMYETAFRGYTQWGRTVWLHIVDDPTTDELAWDEVQASVEELSVQLCLDRNRLLNEVEKHFNAGKGNGGLVAKAAHRGRGRGNTSSPRGFQ